MLKKQKLVAVFLVFSLIIGILPVSVLAADTTGSFEATGGMVYYEIDDAAQTVTITGCDTTVTAIEIPNSLEKLPVTKIADGAFNNNTLNNLHDSLISVKLPSTLKYWCESVLWLHEPFKCRPCGMYRTYNNR